MAAYEEIIVALMLDHPEYHVFFDDRKKYMDHEFNPDEDDENPFLHLALHLGVCDQVANDKPKGIQKLHERLNKKTKNPHESDHALMTCLTEIIYLTQQSGKVMSDKDYIHYAKKTLKKLNYL